MHLGAPSWSRQRVLAVLCLLSWWTSGCMDFEEAHQYFCWRNPVRCGLELPSDETAPAITASTQSATSVMAFDAVSFSVTAQSEKTDTLIFSWEANIGSLGEPLSTGTFSHVTWTAPACVTLGFPVAITVTVSDGGPLPTSHSFMLTANPCPPLSP